MPWRCAHCGLEFEGEPTRASDGTYCCLGCVRQSHSLARTRAQLRQARRRALTDALTALPNRRGFELALARAVAAARRSQGWLGLLLVDVDRFKEVNDELGHLAGDRVLRVLAARMAASVRAGDLCARYGGEEFAVLLPGADWAGAIRAGERLRDAVTAGPVDLSGRDTRSLWVTVSVGAAVWHPGHGEPQLLADADEGLYRAKRAGRDRVCIRSSARGPRA